MSGYAEGENSIKLLCEDTQKGREAKEDLAQGLEEQQEGYSQWIANMHTPP